MQPISGFVKMQSFHFACGDGEKAAGLTSNIYVAVLR